MQPFESCDYMSTCTIDMEWNECGFGRMLIIWNNINKEIKYLYYVQWEKEGHQKWKRWQTRLWPNGGSSNLKRLYLSTIFNKIMAYFYFWFFKSLYLVCSHCLYIAKTLRHMALAKVETQSYHYTLRMFKFQIIRWRIQIGWRWLCCIFAYGIITFQPDG